MSIFGVVFLSFYRRLCGRPSHEEQIEEDRRAALPLRVVVILKRGRAREEAARRVAHGRRGRRRGRQREAAAESVDVAIAITQSIARVVAACRPLIAIAVRIFLKCRLCQLGGFIVCVPTFDLYCRL